MKKRMLIPAILLALVLALALTACGDNAPAAPETPAAPNAPADPAPPADTNDNGDEEVGTATRGAWDDNVYTNYYLGLRFVKPAGWVAATEAEIAEMMGLGADMLSAVGGDIPAEFWDAAGLLLAHDMMAINPFSGANVQIIYERLVFPNTRISAAQYIETATEQLEAMGAEITKFPGTTRIGSYDWHSLRTEIDMGFVIGYSRQFVNVLDGFARMIIVTYFDTSEQADDIMAMFIGLNDPIPEAPAAEHAQELIGAWEWDYDETYVLTFYADGSGTRGFTELIEEFEWRTEGGDHLLLDTGLILESWTFTISDDVLTIDNRQIPGLEFSYIRS